MSFERKIFVVEIFFLNARVWSLMAVCAGNKGGRIGSRQRALGVGAVDGVWPFFFFGGTV